MNDLINSLVQNTDLLITNKDIYFAMITFSLWSAFITATGYIFGVIDGNQRNKREIRAIKEELIKLNLIAEVELRHNHKIKDNI